MSIELQLESKALHKFKPQVILHGGAGTISRANLPPELYEQYCQSLRSYVTEVNELLHHESSPLSALDAACHAVSLMEDDPLFNCGKGSVFNLAGEIEMEASLAVASINGSPAVLPSGSTKRSAAVSLVKQTRHPILLAKEVLLMADADRGFGGTAEMHGHLSGPDVERWGWNRGLERKGKDWFWTQRRWDEHQKGLGKDVSKVGQVLELAGRSHGRGDGGHGHDLPSQGTVGAVCVDRHGNVAVATSTGGLTNKRVGRVGDTPTVGAGFWAEDFVEHMPIPAPNTRQTNASLEHPVLAAVGISVKAIQQEAVSWIRPCFPSHVRETHTRRGYDLLLDLTMEDSDVEKGPQSHRPTQGMCYPKSTCSSVVLCHPKQACPSHLPRYPKRRRAVALSGTGNGDSFLRTNAARTAAAICRFSETRRKVEDGTSMFAVPLQAAVTAVAGSGGELQQSAGERFGKTGEGEGGIIGIEIVDSTNGETDTRVVFDFNCGGMWRAYYEGHQAKVMVFKEEYYG